MVQSDHVGHKSTNLADIEAEVREAFEATIQKTKQELADKSFVPVSVETAEGATAKERERQLTEGVTTPRLSKGVTASAQEQSQRTLRNRGITQTTMDFGQWNPPTDLRTQLQPIPALWEIEPVAQTFADVHKLASNRGNTERDGGVDDGQSGDVGGRSSTAWKSDAPQLDFRYIDQNSVNKLGLGPIPADKLREMADAGQIWVYDPGEMYKFIVMWAPGWNADRYKQYGGAGAPSTAGMSGDIIDRAMELKQSGEDSQPLIGRMMAEDHGGMLNVEQYQTLSDFEYYAQLGASIQNPTYDEAEGYMSILGWRPGAKDVGNIVTFSRDNAAWIFSNNLNLNSTVGDLKYTYMTDDEVDVYNYLLAKEGEEAAQRFLNSLDEELNRRSGVAFGEAIRSVEYDVPRALMTGAAAVASGGDQFRHGVHQLFSKERVPYSANHYMSEYVHNDLVEDGEKLGVIAYDTLETVANVAPSILLSYVTNPVVGVTVQGMSAAGNAYNQALAQGYDPEQAETYGTLIGVSEMALQYVLGGISKLGGVSSEQLLTKITGIENGLLRASAALGIKGLNEVTEEELQLVLQPVYRSIVFGEDYDAPTIEEYVYTAVVSFAMLGVMEAGDIASYARNRPVQAVEWDFSDTGDFATFAETDTAVDPDGNMGYDGSVTDGQYNRIPDNTSITGHIFRDAEGHIPDTPENRRLLESVANSEESFLGYDKYGNAWYTRKLPDGTSVWVQVRNGNIFEGGINKTPKKWNPDTGLKKQ